jgi:hypothetical protein
MCKIWTHQEKKLKKKKSTCEKNVLMSLGKTKTMFNLMIWKDKYEKVPTWNWQVGQHTIDYVNTSYTWKLIVVLACYSKLVHTNVERLSIFKEKIGG